MTDDASLTARRDHIVAQLGAAWAAEAIGEQEMERRMVLAFDARDPAALEALVADLPASASHLPVAAPRAAPAGMAHLPALRRVVLGSVQERVRAVVPPRVEFGARFGNLELDLSAAYFTSDVTDIVVDAAFSNIEIYLPHNVVLESHVHSFLSSVEQKGSARAGQPGTRLVRISGRAVFGNVEVTVAPGVDVVPTFD